MNRTITTIAAAFASTARRMRDEAAEGVISTAIAVLILAFIGAGMYVGFNAIMRGACEGTAQNVENAVAGSSDISCDA